MRGLAAPLLGLPRGVRRRRAVALASAPAPAGEGRGQGRPALRRSPGARRCTVITWEALVPVLPWGWAPFLTPS